MPNLAILFMDKGGEMLLAHKAKGVSCGWSVIGTKGGGGGVMGIKLVSLGGKGVNTRVQGGASTTESGGIMKVAMLGLDLAWV